MTRFTQAEVDAYNARRKVCTPEVRAAIARDVARRFSECEREADLHVQILGECNRRQWLALHGSMAHRTFRTTGEFDFVICASDGRVLLIECKARGGKLSMEQKGLHAWAERLGHKPHVVYSMREFIAIADQTVFSEAMIKTHD